MSYLQYEKKIGMTAVLVASQLTRRVSLTPASTLTKSDSSPVTGNKKTEFSFHPSIRPSFHAFIPPFIHPSLPIFRSTFLSTILFREGGLGVSHVRQMSLLLKVEFRVPHFLLRHMYIATYFLC